MEERRKSLRLLKNMQTNGVKIMTILFKRDILFIEKKIMKKIKMAILLWIQGWTGQLNSWAWTEWDSLHRQDWAKDYKKWKKK